MVRNMSTQIDMTRRVFLQATAAGSALAGQPGASAPWYKRVCRWGQTNITEKDPVRYDIAWWREYWKRTEVQGVIINAGGIVAYYPSKFPLQHRAEFLNGRDLFGELAKAAHEDGLAVLARMDSNRTAEDFYQAHPDWFARDADGQPYRAADKYVTCVNSPYYDEYLPGVLPEIVERSHPEGFTDNSWGGLGRDTICYCENCERKFREKTGQAIPARQELERPGLPPVDRVELRAPHRDLGPEQPRHQGRRRPGLPLDRHEQRLRHQPRRSLSGDCKEICERAEMVMLDHQARAEPPASSRTAIPANWFTGCSAGTSWRPRAWRCTRRRATTFRAAGQAGGGGAHVDDRGVRGRHPALVASRRRIPGGPPRVPHRRAGDAVACRPTSEYLIEPPAGGHGGRGVVAAEHRFLRPRQRRRPGGRAVRRFHCRRWCARASRTCRCTPTTSTATARALCRAGPAERRARMSDAQCAAVRRFVERGGGADRHRRTSLYDEWGDARPDFALADLFGAHCHRAGVRSRTGARAADRRHTYLRLAPELRARCLARRPATSPLPSGERHPVLRGFDETDILAFGGTLEPLRSGPRRRRAADLRPAVPRLSARDGVDADAEDGHSRAGGERSRARRASPICRPTSTGATPATTCPTTPTCWPTWCAGPPTDRLPLEVKGAGLIDCHLYRQPGRVILHLVNLTSAGTWRGPDRRADSHRAAPDRVKLPDDVKGRSAQLLVSGARKPAGVREGWATFDVKSVSDHEVVVIG